MLGDLGTVLGIISLSPYHKLTDVTLGASGLWLGTRTVTGVPWLHGQQVSIYMLCAKPAERWDDVYLYDLFISSEAMCF